MSSTEDELYTIKRAQLQTLLDNALERKVKIDAEIATGSASQTWYSTRSTNLTLINTIMITIKLLEGHNETRLAREAREQERAEKEARRKRWWGWLDKF